MELNSSKEWNEHLLQHFQQRVCSGCGTKLICIGDIWYGPHIDSNCCILTTEVSYETPEEVILPDFIEMKQEVYDAEDEITDVNEANDIFNDPQFVSNEAGDESGTAPYSPNINQIGHNVEDETNLVFHMDQTNGFAKRPYSLVELKKQKIAIETVPNYTILTSAGLTDEQLSSRKCPICHKIIVNKQNLICHMNIHNGQKPFVCTVCKKSFAHIRNLIRHKEQQRHCEMEFKCPIKGCKKSFMSNNKLHRHMKVVHFKQQEMGSNLDKAYPCDQCDKNFMTLGFLKMHLRHIHNDQQ